MTYVSKFHQYHMAFKGLNPYTNFETVETTIILAVNSNYILK